MWGVLQLRWSRLLAKHPVVLDSPDFVSVFSGWILSIIILILFEMCPKYFLTVRIFTCSIISGTIIDLFNRGSKPLNIILGFQVFQKINPIFKLQRAAVRLPVINIVTHHSRKTVPSILLDYILTKYTAFGLPVSLMLLLFVFSRCREVLCHLKQLT